MLTQRLAFQTIRINEFRKLAISFKHLHYTSSTIFTECIINESKFSYCHIIFFYKQYRTPQYKKTSLAFAIPTEKKKGIVMLDALSCGPPTQLARLFSVARARVRLRHVAADVEHM